MYAQERKKRAERKGEREREEGIKKKNSAQNTNTVTHLTFTHFST